ncbi:hypothetical protein O6H91_11G051200 [Diphasiastrum complanatum]|uniref:Uncharacterized protein n=1 Tax=Diphasiastrum complanatum TaxID=34168 RepID=A0ACC2C925_DIPCM|nr:hypothetical protein O6H91_11G051200 [Diphasiastrum complanatum]
MGASALVRPSLLLVAVEVSAAACLATASSSSFSSQPLCLRDFGAAYKTFAGYQLSALTQPFAIPCSSSSLVSSRRQQAQSPIFTSAVTSELAAASMAIPTEEAVQQEQGVMNQKFQTEFMVDMKCEGCVQTVHSKLEGLEGVSSVEVDLPNQVVRIFGNSTIKALTEALEKTGRNARLIGQGMKEDYAVSAAVAEFKGPQVHGVVRFAQDSMENVRVEASISGLSPGLHGWSVNEYGDLTRGAASTGPIFHPKGVIAAEPLGDLGNLEVDGTGSVDSVGMKGLLKVGDLIGRALVIYETQNKEKHGIAAAVIARSAGVGENHKKLCTCDGTIIWEATNNDFAKL